MTKLVAQTVESVRIYRKKALFAQTRQYAPRCQAIFSQTLRGSFPSPLL